MVVKSEQFCPTPTPTMTSHIKSFSTPNPTREHCKKTTSTPTPKPRRPNLA